jgi:hypothetical protein
MHQFVHARPVAHRVTRGGDPDGAALAVSPELALLTTRFPQSTFALLVVLDPGIEVCKYRNAGREPVARSEFDGYERLEAA